MYCIDGLDDEPSKACSIKFLLILGMSHPRMCICALQEEVNAKKERNVVDNPGVNGEQASQQGIKGS